MTYLWVENNNNRKLGKLKKVIKSQEKGEYTAENLHDNYQVYFLIIFLYYREWIIVNYGMERWHFFNYAKNIH